MEDYKDKIIGGRKRAGTRRPVAVSSPWVIPVSMVVSLALAACFGADKKTKTAGKKPGSEVNSLCYVCHFDLQTEKIATIHLAKGIGCDHCHGSSTHHMHDEMLMTKPDVLIGRSQVEQTCLQCHQGHKNAEAVEAFRQKWLGRRRPNGRAITSEAVCTDCHGTHNIVKRTGNDSNEQGQQWVSVFNGVDLSGWRASGGASWSVERGQIVATCGPRGRGGELLTEAQYDDYQLSITFKADWPIQAGIWLHAGGAEPGPRIEIFESRKPTAFTGSVLASGKGLVLVNMRADSVDREGWNTLSVEVRQGRVAVWLNAEEIGAVRVDGPGKGKIGLYLDKQRARGTAKLWVREVLIQPLAKPAKQKSEGSQD
ncbi:MAG: family 16 glycoside hydrolase [Planctomycetota bacterium]|jgi:hypothetical protein